MLCKQNWKYLCVVSLACKMKRGLQWIYTCSFPASLLPGDQNCIWAMHAFLLQPPSQQGINFVRGNTHQKSGWCEYLCSPAQNLEGYSWRVCVSLYQALGNVAINEAQPPAPTLSTLLDWSVKVKIHPSGKGQSVHTEGRADRKDAQLGLVSAHPGRKACLLYLHRQPASDSHTESAF